LRAAILTISTTRAAGDDGDESGDALAEFAASVGAEVAGREVIPDDRGLIAERLIHWADGEKCDLVLTTGGTGFSPNDQTPEATRAVIERDAPGIPEAMRAESRPHTRHWMLSRAVAGIRGTTLIVNFPGSPKSIGEAGGAISAALPHALELIAGKRSAH
jgi:molybdopterin adenylyltransferase